MKHIRIKFDSDVFLVKMKNTLLANMMIKYLQFMEFFVIILIIKISFSPCAAARNIFSRKNEGGKNYD